MCNECKLNDAELGRLFTVLESPVTDMQTSGFGTFQKHDPEQWLTQITLWTDAGLVEIYGEFSVKAKVTAEVK